MILALALMVISYGVGHRLFEFSWKGMLRISHPSAMAYQVGGCIGGPGHAQYHLVRRTELQKHQPQSLSTHDMALPEMRRERCMNTAPSG